MPKIPKDYSKTSFYRIVCKDIHIKDCYIGHTTNIVQRRNCHKSRCNNSNSNKHNLKVYKFIRDNGGWDNWILIEIEKKKVQNGSEALKEEYEYYKMYNATLNFQIPTRTRDEYINNNKDNILKQAKIYRDNNKEKINNYIENNKEQIIDYQKTYYENNKEHLLQKQKQYAEEHKEQINKKITCECGSIVIKRFLKKHKETKKHLEYLKENINI